MKWEDFFKNMYVFTHKLVIVSSREHHVILPQNAMLLQWKNIMY